MKRFRPPKTLTTTQRQRRASGSQALFPGMTRFFTVRLLRWIRNWTLFAMHAPGSGIGWDAWNRLGDRTGSELSPPGRVCGCVGSLLPPRSCRRSNVRPASWSSAASAFRRPSAGTRRSGAASAVGRHPGTTVHRHIRRRRKADRGSPSGSRHKGVGPATRARLKPDALVRRRAGAA